MPSRLVTPNFQIQELPVANGNFEWGRQGVDIDTIMLHLMIGTWQSANTRFNNAGDAQHASVHYGVPTDENTPLLHWVDESNIANNCGNWEYNQRSIGIEHEGRPGDKYPVILYVRSAHLVKDIADFYNFPIDRKHVKDHRSVYATACPDDLDTDRILDMAANNDLPDVATLLRSDANQIVTLSSVLLDTIDGLQVSDSVKYQMGFEAAEIKRKMGASESRYPVNNHPV